MKRPLLITILISVLLLSLPLTASAAPAADGNAMAAIALFIDTSGHYVPGMELLNRGLNEVIRFKVNALMLGSEVQTGNEVLRDLRRCNISAAADATPEALASYNDKRHVNYIILLSVRPLDVAIDLKAFSTVSSSYLVDKTICRPDGSEALSTLDVLSSMVGDELSGLLQSLKALIPGMAPAAVSAS